MNQDQGLSKAFKNTTVSLDGAALDVAHLLLLVSGTKEYNKLV